MIKREKSTRLQLTLYVGVGGGVCVWGWISPPLAEATGAAVEIIRWSSRVDAAEPLVHQSEVHALSGWFA